MIFAGCSCIAKKSALLCFIHKNVLQRTLGPFTKDVQLTPGEGGLRNPDVQLSFDCDSIVLSGRRGGLEILVLAGRPL